MEKKNLLARYDNCHLIRVVVGGRYQRFWTTDVQTRYEPYTIFRLQLKKKGGFCLSMEKKVENDWKWESEHESEPYVMCGGAL